MEVGTASPTVDDLKNTTVRLVYYDRQKKRYVEENWISSGPTQCTGQQHAGDTDTPGLEHYLRYICERTYGSISEENNTRIVAATHGLKTSKEMAAPHIEWIKKLYEEAGAETLLSSAIKVWSNGYYIKQAIDAYEFMGFQGCNLGFTMCMYLANAGWHRIRGYGQGVSRYN